MKSILRRLRGACRAAEAEIKNTSRGSRFAAALASEGYAAGYRDALLDVEAMMTHGHPSDPRNYWDEQLQAEYAAQAAKGGR